MVPKQLIQLFLSVLETWLTVFIELLLYLEVGVHAIFLRLQRDVGLDNIDEAIDVLTFLVEHIDCLRQHCLALGRLYFL
jgi:hypothetical protein